MALPNTPVTETLNVSETRKQLSETLDRVRRREARVVVEKSGIPVGAIVSLRDLEDILEMQRRRDELREVLSETRAAFSGIPVDEIEREVEKAITEVEESRRQARLSSTRHNP